MFLQIEFAVHMTCEKCVNAISKSIADLKDIRNVDISLERGTVILETNLPYSIIQERIERTGRQAVLKGYGGLNNFFYVIYNVLSFDICCNNLFCLIHNFWRHKYVFRIIRNRRGILKKTWFENLFWIFLYSIY